MPAQIRLPVSHGACSQQHVYLFKELRLSHVDDTLRRQPERIPISTPVKRRRDLLKIGSAHFVEKFVRIALIDAGERRLSQSRLNVHYRLRLGSRRGGAIAEELERA